MNKTNHQLILRSADIPNLENDGVTLRAKYTNNLPTVRNNSVNNTQYSINVEQSDMTFKNINLRSILGQDYKSGEFCNLKLNSIVFGLTANGSTFSANEQDRTFNIELSGLPFLSSYQNGSTYSDRAVLATVRVASGSNANIFTYINRQISFKIDDNQSNQTCNLRIRYLDIETNTLEPSSGALTNGTNYPNITLNLSFEII
jgi:hypothetical protein